MYIEYVDGSEYVFFSDESCEVDPRQSYNQEFMMENIMMLIKKIVL